MNLKYQRTSLKRRKARGGSLILVLAFFFIVIGLSFFCLRFTRMLATHQEQRTAVEAAALAAAHDLSRVVIEDPNFGFISLSDSAPTGKATTAGDNYYVEVQSINSLLCTVRLDMIIADKLNDSLMTKLALNDYANAIAAKDSLVAALHNCIDNKVAMNDLDGKPIDPYGDAANAYQTNAVRISGPQNRLVPGSLKLTLGCVPGLTTNSALPQPTSLANVADSSQEDGYYKSLVNVPYNRQDFVLAPVSNNVTLVDAKQFQTKIDGLPYFIPSILKCEADEEFNETDQLGKASQRVVHAIACAQPACLIDLRPAPGALSIQIFGAVPPELQRVIDVFTSPEVTDSPTDMLQTAVGGDNPPNALSNLKVPEFTDVHPQFGNVMSLVLYDWIRRAGPNLDVGSLLSTLNSPLNVTPGKITLYEKDGTGAVVTPSASFNDGILPVSQNQLMATSGGAVYSSNKSVYDVFVRDFVYQPGRIKGGLHAGEPMSLVKLSTEPPLTKNPGLVQAASFDYPPGPAGGAVRPTYQQTGSALDITFRARK
ncbi:MAG TPA: hypothetical protein V6C89_16195 [Drouetiella sp.]|jgi:hypothetical protein